MIVTTELERKEKETVLASGGLLYDVSLVGLQRTANSLISCQSPGQGKNQKHPNKREVVISKL